MKTILTIVVPCFNKGDLVLQSVASIEAAVQKMSYEIIIVDDESSDKTTLAALESLKKRSNIQVIRQKNAGLSGARNTGIKHSKGEHVFFLDNDDLISDNFFELTVRTLQEHQEAAYTYPDTVFFGERESLREAQAFDDQKLRINNYIPSACVFRGEVIRSQQYDTNFPALEDWDMLLTLLEKDQKGVPTNGAFLFYRIIKQTSLTTQYSKNNEWVVLLNKVRAKHKLSGATSKRQDFLLYKVFPLVSPLFLKFRKQNFKKILKNHHYLHHEYARLVQNV